VDVIAVVGASVLSLACVAKSVELIVDMWWTWFTGPRFATAVRGELRDHDVVDVARIEIEYRRPQPMYTLFRRLPSARLRLTLGQVYRSYGLVTALSTILLLAAPRMPAALLVANATVLMTMVILFMANALARRLQLGPVDSLNRDLVPAVAGDGAIDAAAAARRLGSYFLGLVYLIIVGYAGAYAALAEVDPAAFTNHGNAPPAVMWTYYSVTTTATVGFGDVHPTGTWGFVATTTQIMAGPMLLAWLISAFSATLLPAGNDRP
jgi:hypothetical protein